MTKKPENSREFFNNWARTNSDPDGNYLEKYTIGGENDSYFQYIRLKYAEIHQILTEICTEIDEIMQKTQQIELENRKNGENSGKNSEIEVKSTENTQKYKWISEKTNCFKCKSLDGRIFDHKPNVEEIAHPNCKCEIVEVNEIEAEMAKMERENEIGRRDGITKYISENIKIQKDGKWYDPKTGLEEKNGKYGDCARYVTNALEKGGVDLRKIRDTKYSGLENNTHAYQYGNYLTDEKAGFAKIGSGGSGKNPVNYTPKPGDVAIFEPLRAGHEGHMQMFDGKNWVSDFMQLNNKKIENMGSGFWAGESYRDIQPSYAIYRNTKWEDWL